MWRPGSCRPRSAAAIEALEDARRGRPIPTSCCASGWPAAAPRCRWSGSRSTSTTRASPTTHERQPVDRPVVVGGPAAYFTTLPIKAAAAALRQAGLPAIVSNTAGTFVCNHVFYGLMHLVATRRPAIRGGFLHLPYLPEQAAGQDGAPSMALGDIVRGVEIVLRVAAERREDIAVAEGAIS